MKAITDFLMSFFKSIHRFPDTYYSNIILEFNDVDLTDLLTLKKYKTIWTHVDNPTPTSSVLYVISLIMINSCFQQKIELLSAIKINLVHLI